MAGIRTWDRESQVQRPNHYTTEPPVSQIPQQIQHEKCTTFSSKIKTTISQNVTLTKV